MLSVIIGRFQTPYIHEGHKQIIKKAKELGDVAIFVGCTSATGTDKNPLNFEVRAKMLSDYVKSDMIKPLWDMPSDKDWSDQVDSLIEQMGYKEATIFGGRDNSIEGYYSGKHKINIISSYGDYSSTEIREDCKDLPNLVGREFRQGIIYHTQNRYPIVYSTVDVILYDDSKKKDKILMGKKGDKFALIGGFVDPHDKNLQEAACRELEEETAILMHPDRLHYFTSTKVDDSRYKGTKDSIMTHVFYTSYIGLPDMSKIDDKEFSEFRFIGEEDINLVQECHKHIVLNFFNSFFNSK